MDANTQFEIVDIELFIAKVKRHPEIWNLNCESYLDRLKKRFAWITICRDLCEGFDEKEQREKNEIKNVLLKKWRNIKDTFLKTLKKPKSGSGYERGQQYIYARQLSFLRQVSLVSKSKSNLSSKQPMSIEDNEECRRATELECGENNSTPNGSFNNTIKRKHDLESSLLAFKNVHKSSPTSKKIRSNPSQSFFESLDPMLNSFTKEEVIDFRMDVLSIIRRMKKAQQKCHNSTRNVAIL